MDASSLLILMNWKAKPERDKLKTKRQQFYDVVNVSYSFKSPFVEPL